MMRLHCCIMLVVCCTSLAVKASSSVKDRENNNKMLESEFLNKYCPTVRNWRNGRIFFLCRPTGKYPLGHIAIGQLPKANVSTDPTFCVLERILFRTYCRTCKRVEDCSLALCIKPYYWTTHKHVKTKITTKKQCKEFINGFWEDLGKNSHYKFYSGGIFKDEKHPSYYYLLQCEKCGDQPENCEVDEIAMGNPAEAYCKNTPAGEVWAYKKSNYSHTWCTVLD